MQTLEQQLTELEQFIPSSEIKNEKVSKVPIGWQIDHSLRVINSIIIALEQSDPNQFRGTFNFWRVLFLTLNFLPRGKGRAPKKVSPNTEITEDDLHRRLGYARENRLKLDQLSINAHFPHPYFGNLHRANAVKFIRIHTEHHLKIIRDILRG